jgi:hypothetical protein
LIAPSMTFWSTVNAAKVDAALPGITRTRP